MEKMRNKIAEIITQTHKTPLEQADEILLLLGVVGQSGQLVCETCGEVEVEEQGDWCDKCLGINNDEAN